MSFGERALLHSETRAATVRVTSENATVLAMDRLAFVLLIQPSENGDVGLRAMPGSNIQLAANLKATLASQNPEVEQAKTQIMMTDLTRVGVLGRGAFGFVSLEKCSKTGKLYALKAMSKAHIVQERLKSMIANEKACMELLNNDFVVKLCKTYRDATCVYLLLEPCFGGELFDVYADRGDELWGSEKHAMFYAACVAEGLDHMHSRRVIYRDLKLENCLVALNGYVKLTDLGIGKVCVGKTYTVCGTTDYFAPETLRQSGHNRGVDWWALGVLLYIVMTGRFPFEAADVMKTYRKIMKGFAKVNFPDDVPEHCASLIRALCQKNPEERLTMGSLGFQNFKDHPWYRGFSWRNLENHTTPAPWMPDTSEEVIMEKVANRVVEALPDMEYIDDGTGWDDCFADEN
jgi:serine/threonine protein kinase